MRDDYKVEVHDEDLIYGGGNGKQTMAGREILEKESVRLLKRDKGNEVVKNYKGTGNVMVSLAETGKL